MTWLSLPIHSFLSPAGSVTLKWYGMELQTRDGSRDMRMFLQQDLGESNEVGAMTDHAIRDKNMPALGVVSQLPFEICFRWIMVPFSLPFY
jgi:hypothetical protein